MNGRVQSLNVTSNSNSLQRLPGAFLVVPSAVVFGSRCCISPCWNNFSLLQLQLRRRRHGLAEQKGSAQPPRAKPLSAVRQRELRSAVSNWRAAAGPFD